MNGFLLDFCVMHSVDDIMTLNLYFYRRCQDWSIIWGGSGTIYGWGHNHRGQLGGIEGAKIKSPTICDALAALKPVQVIGGEQTLFCVTADGKVCFVAQIINILYYVTKVTKFNIQICPSNSIQSQSFECRLNLNLVKFVFSNRLFPRLYIFFFMMECIVLVLNI